MREWIGRHPFLLLGLVTIFLYLALGRVAVASSVVRVLIVPAYIMWMIATVVQVRLGGVAGLPDAVSIVVLLLKVAMALLPYLAADALLTRWRRRRERQLKPAT